MLKKKLKKFLEDINPFYGVTGTPVFSKSLHSKPMWIPLLPYFVLFRRRLMDSLDSDSPANISLQFNSYMRVAPRFHSDLPENVTILINDKKNVNKAR